MLIVRKEVFLIIDLAADFMNNNRGGGYSRAKVAEDARHGGRCYSFLLQDPT
jgi:hypothetical protein